MARKEKENFQRQSFLVVDYINNGLKDLLNLDITRNYSSFEDFINTNQHELYHLCYNRGRCCQCNPQYILPHNRIIYPVQLNQLLDQTGSKHPRHRSGPCCSLAHSGLLIDVLDITLTKSLLIQFCSHLLSPSIKAAVETLINIRNSVYGHAKEARIPDIEYISNWSKTETALIEISKLCGNENETKQKLDDLKKRSLDETLCIQYQNRILEEIHRDSNLKKHVEVLTSKVEKFETTLEELKNKVKTENEEKRRKCEELSKAKIAMHAKSDTFVTTSGLTAALESLNEKGTVILVGPPGSGKSTTAVEILRHYDCKQYVCLCLNDVTEFPNIISLEEECVVLCDDIFGQTNCKYSEEIHSNVLENIYLYVNEGNSKFIITVRESIKKICSQVFECEKLFYSSSIINLGLDFKMTLNEKQDCLLKFCDINNIAVVNELPGENCETTKYILTSIVNKIVSLDSSPLLGFPQTCALFTSNPVFTKQGLSFFKNANSILLHNINDMRQHGNKNKNDRVDYTLLLYVLVNNNKIDLSKYDIDEINEVCALVFSDPSYCFTTYDIDDSLDRLQGIYFQNADGKILTFQHRSIFEVVILSCKIFKKEKLITFMDLDFIVEMIRPEDYVGTEAEMFITVYRQEYNILANHIISLLICCNQPYDFVEKLITSPMIKQFGVELIKILTEVFNAKHDITLCATYCRWFLLKIHKDVSLILDGFDFSMACLLFCENNNAMISFLCSVFPIKSKSTFDYFFASCYQLNKCKAQKCWTLLKNQDYSIHIHHDYLYHNVKYLIRNPYLNFLFEIVDDWKMLGSDIMDLILEMALQRAPLKIVSYLLEHWDNSLIDANKAMISAGSSKSSEKVGLILRFFDSKLLYINAAISKACDYWDSDLMQLLVQTFDESKFNTTKTFNMACLEGDLDVVKLLLQICDHRMFDAKAAFNDACDTLGSQSIVDVLLKTFDHSCFDVKTAFHNACVSSNYEIIHLLLRTFDHSLFDASKAFCMACGCKEFNLIQLLSKTFNHSLFNVSEAFESACDTGNIEIVKWMLQTFDHNLFDVQIAFKRACHYDNKELVVLLLTTFNLSSFNIQNDMAHISYYYEQDPESVRLLMQTFDHNLFDLKRAFYTACSKGYSKSVELLLQNFDHSLLDVKTALNIACEELESGTIQLLLQTCDQSLFDARTSFNLTCNYGNQGVDIIKLFLKTFDHRLFEIKTAFNLACKEGGSKLVALLLQTFDHSFFDVKTALNMACISGFPEAVTLLLQTFDHSLFDIDNCFEIACKHDNSKSVKLFLHMFDHSLFDVKTAYNKACKDGYSDIVILLLQTFHNSLFDLKAAFNMACLNGDIILVRLFLQIFDRSSIDVKTAFNMSCRYGDIELVEFLLQTFDHSLFNLKAAFNISCQPGRLELVKLLLQIFDHSLFDAEKAFNMACKYKFSESLDLFLQTFDHSFFNAKIAFDMVCRSGHLESIKLLLEKFDHSSFDVKTSFGMACKSRNSKSVELLLDTFDISISEVKLGMVSASKMGRENVIKLLLKRYDCELLDINTAVFVACRNGMKESVELLLSFIDPSFMDFTSAFIAACKVGNTELVILLLEKLDHSMLDIQSIIVTAVNSQNRKAIKLLLRKFDHKRIDIDIVLCNAFKVCSVKTILSILKKFDKQSMNANYGMHLACAYGYTHIVEWLIKNFNDNVFDVTTIIGDMYNSSNVTRVRKNKNDFTTERIKAVTFLLGNFDHKLFDMKSTMKDACDRKDKELVNHLLQNVDQTLFNTTDMLKDACETGNIELISFILQNFDHQSFDVVTPYKIARRNRHTDVVEIFLTFSDDVALNQTDTFIDMFDNFCHWCSCHCYCSRNRSGQ